MTDRIRNIIIDSILEAAPSTSYNEHTISESTRFYEMGIDSISMLSIILKLDEKLSLDLMELGDQLDAPITVADLFQLVEKLLSPGLLSTKKKL